LDEDMPQGEAMAMDGELRMRDETQIPCGDDNPKNNRNSKRQTHSNGSSKCNNSRSPAE
jgi:hypothetical protein